MSYKQQLKDLGITVKFLAQKLDISQTMMSYYVNNTRTPPIEVEEEIKRVLKAIKQIA